MTWNRRDFVKASALATVAGAIPRRAGAQQPAAAPPPAPAIFTPLRRNVGIFNQRGGTIGWLINSDGVLVVDSQFADTAPNLLAGLKERSPRQIDVLINSHHHPDHTGGNGVLRSAKQIVAHARSKENQTAQAERAKAETTLPDITFPDTWSVKLGDETVRARHWGPAHTGGDAAIHFEQANIVHLGDLLNNRGYPNVDAPAGASVHGWIQVLEKMAPAYPADALYVYGHAEAGHPFIGTRPDLLYQRDYFTAVIEMARRARKEGKTKEELAKVEVLPTLRTFWRHQVAPRPGADIAYDELAKLGKGRITVASTTRTGRRSRGPAAFDLVGHLGPGSWRPALGGQGRLDLLQRGPHGQQVLAARSDQRGQLQQARSRVAVQDRHARAASGIQARRHAGRGQRRPLHDRRHPPLGRGARWRDRRADLGAQPSRREPRRRRRRVSSRAAACRTGPTARATSASST